MAVLIRGMDIPLSAVPMSIVDEHGEAIALLEATGNYRVLRRLMPPAQFSEDDGTSKKIGIVLDVETTGLDYTKHEILELGMVKFEFAPDGRIFRILDTYNQLRQPKDPIPAEITQLTGITDEMVAGKEIDLAEVVAFVEPAAVIIAHNAAYDRKFRERFSPCFVHHITPGPARSMRSSGARKDMKALV